ncbi:hypothetical protein L2W42_32050 (plasmid) [Rhizobium gallicum]|nr:DUF6665 family protein [Rhizobium gallicum]ULJ74945.1 hypothetical protein L2W42_32050 [Rhizobium gallicum]
MERHLVSFRPPRSFSDRPNSAFSPLEYELASERADALGRQGRKVEAALAKLAASTKSDNRTADREGLLNDAAEAVWALFIQREICGLRNNWDLVTRYGIPGEVLARVGAIRR